MTDREIRDCKDCRHCQETRGFNCSCHLEVMDWFATKIIKRNVPRRHARVCEFYERREAEDD